MTALRVDARIGGNPPVSSPAPCVLQIGSPPPAPTLSLYNGSKAASFAFYQALAVENPWVTFTAVLPSTVRGEDFFHNAADGGTVRGADPQSYGLSHEEVVVGCADGSI